jgi:flavin reductase (DIM6/NTAB) family NADH-FMN oxidoreductase RutF
MRRGSAVWWASSGQTEFVALRFAVMQIDPLLQTKQDNYKLLTNLVVPRPIAWITSLNSAGVVNLAPFSFFNAVGSDPMYVVIGIGHRDDGEPKDTAKNIASGGDFVVNLVTEELLGAMNISAADFPPDQSEVTAAKLRAAPSVRVKSPRLAEAQASLECKLFSSQPLGANILVIGEVVMFHVADRLVGPRLHVNNFAPIGRLGSPSMYCRTTDRFDLPRMTYGRWREEHKD